jgi:hypothetical protein
LAHELVTDDPAITCLHLQGRHVMETLFSLGRPVDLVPLAKTLLPKTPIVAAGKTHGQWLLVKLVEKLVRMPWLRASGSTQ